MRIDTGTDELLCELRDRVATVTLNKPPSHALSVFPAATFREDAHAYAKRIANGPATALRLMKRNLNRGALQGLRESLAMEAQHLVLSGQSEDAKEAISAFVERTPIFTFR